MVAIHPFRALRYSPDVIGDLSRVIAPPYDMIEAEEQEQLYRASPYNIVRLILGTQDPHDTPEENRYTRAQREFRAWCDQGVLRRDDTPALYALEHLFDAGGVSSSRLGFLALMQFIEAGEPMVLRHEATLSAPKEDRAKLLQAIPANLSPIFCVYPDEGATVHRLLEQQTAAAAPLAQASRRHEIFRLWAITSPDVIGAVAQRLAAIAALIADGHHRFEVAYAQRHRYGAAMTYFASMTDPGLLVRPIHRIAQPLGSSSLQALRELCLLEPVADLAAVTTWLTTDATAGRFGYYDGRAWYRLSLKPDRLTSWLSAPSVPSPLAGLDVSILHGLIFPRVELDGASVQYTADTAQLLQAVGSKGERSGWLLRGIPLPQIYALAAQGLTMPPKSTYFYPKVPSGFTINPLT